MAGWLRNSHGISVVDTANRSIVEVVCGVLTQPDGRFLLAQRPEGRIWAGFWEFPGGKIEPGESPAEALSRELREELGIKVCSASPWHKRLFDYPHARVRLHFFRIWAWTGEVQSLEGQQFVWTTPGHVDVEPLLPANTPVLRALQIPSTLAITPESSVPLEAALAQVSAGLASHQWSWLQVRRGAQVVEEWSAWQALAHRYGTMLSLNAPLAIAEKLTPVAWHASSGALAGLTHLPDFEWTGASVHNLEELARAGELGFDYAVLGSVKATASHPGHSGMGWDSWQRLAHEASLPLFAIGGLTADDRADARVAGAHGIAMIRGAW